MSSYSTINFNYNKALSQANKLEALASELRNLAGNDVQETLNNLSNQWSGDSASMYIRKGVALQEDIIQTAKRLSDTAAAIRTAAKRVRFAEITAKKVAEIRKGTSSGN